MVDQTKSNFWTSAEWFSGYTGNLNIINNGENLKGWEVEFEAPFKITDIWNAEIISHEGNKYVIKNLDYNQDLAKGETETITFNAEKVDGEIVAPANIMFDTGGLKLTSETIDIENNDEFSGANSDKISETTDAKDNDEFLNVNFGGTSAEWLSGYTGNLTITNNGEDLNGWEVEFEAPFEISDIWNAEIISHEGNKYVIKNLDYNQDLAKGETETITFNAEKVDGEVIVPTFSTISAPNEFVGEIIQSKPIESTNSTESILLDPIAESVELNDNSARLESINDPTIDFKPIQNEAKGQFNYGEALQKALLFFEANRSGDLPEDNRIEWRGDSAMKDGADVGRDLTGGYYDSGDHVKFGLPMSASNTMLTWGGIEYEQAYKQSGQWDELLDTVKWGTDYFLKAHETKNGKTSKLWVQVGEGGTANDHGYWGAPETVEANTTRNAFAIDPANPGSDVAAGTASALASAAILFRATDDAYADKLLKNAKQLFEFADKYRGKYSDSVPEANPFYTSWSGYADELAESAVWLYKATGEQKYLSRAEQLFDNEVGYPTDWSWGWDNKSNAANLLLAQESSNSEYKDMFEKWAKDWVNGTGPVKNTSGGLAWQAGWGSLALSSATAFLVGLYSDTVEKNSGYEDFTHKQIDYILGDNPRNASYMIGFGENYPQRPHHRGSAPNLGGSAMAIQENILYGAMVGGPRSADDFDYKDRRDDVVTNEVSLIYNAPLTSSLVQAYDDFGGTPLSDRQLNDLIGIDTNFQHTSS